MQAVRDGHEFGGTTIDDRFSVESSPMRRDILPSLLECSHSQWRKLVDETEVGKLVCRMVRLARRRAEVYACMFMERRQEFIPSMVGRKEDGVGTSCVNVAMILVQGSLHSAPRLNLKHAQCCSVQMSLIARRV